ncbi:MAG: lactate utilization protein [Chitinophagaceae bacterium]
MSNTAKENILKKIRQALATPAPIPFPLSEGNDSLFQLQTQEPEIEFAENFTKLLGIFSYCADEQELADQLKVLAEKRQWQKIYCRDAAVKGMLQQHNFNAQWFADLNTCSVSITDCEFLVARTGSIVMSSGQASGRTTSVYAPVHICIAYTSQLVYDIKEGLQKMKEKYAGKLPSLITFATGPSRTADIEKTLVVGIHGPKEVYVFLVEG